MKLQLISDEEREKIWTRIHNVLPGRIDVQIETGDDFSETVAHISPREGHFDDFEQSVATVQKIFEQELMVSRNLRGIRPQLQTTRNFGGSVSIQLVDG